MTLYLTLLPQKFCIYIYIYIYIRKWNEVFLVCVWMGVYATSCLFQTMQQEFGLTGVFCQKRNIISVVCVRNNLLVVTSVSFLCQSKAIFSLNLSNFKARSLGRW